MVCAAAADLSHSARLTGAHCHPRGTPLLLRHHHDQTADESNEPAGKAGILQDTTGCDAASAPVDMLMMASTVAPAPINAIVRGVDRVLPVLPL